MNAELYRRDEPGDVVAVATWTGTGASIDVRESVDGLDRLLRPTPVVVHDASLLPQGSRGETVLQPGSIQWFRAALATRAEALGLAVRFVAGDVRNGWDPASNYRTFAEQVGRLTAPS